MATINLTELRRTKLNERMSELTKQYEAAWGQLNSALSGVDEVKLTAQIADIEKKMQEVEADLKALDQSSGNRAARQRDWESALPLIDFIQPWNQFHTLFTQYVDREAGGAMMLLLPHYQIMCANLFVRRVHNWLKEHVGYEKVIYRRVELLEHNQLSDLQMLSRLGSVFSHALPKKQTALSPQQVQRHTKALVDKMCNALAPDDVLLIEVAVVPDLFSATDFLCWFLDEFWKPLLHWIPQAARDRPAIKCLMVIAAHQPFPQPAPLPERYCMASDFCEDHRERIVHVPLTRWSEDDLTQWLRRYSGMKWTEKILHERAHALYVLGDNGLPFSVLTSIRDELTQQLA